jgi:hypothetical protein
MFIFSASIKFTGTIEGKDNGDVDLVIYDYYQSGKKKSKDTAIEKIQTVVESINDAVEGKDLKISASYIPSDRFAGIVRLNMKDFQVLPAIPGLRIRNVRLESDSITIASCNELIRSNGAEVQAYLGESIINELIRMFTRPTTRAITNIDDIILDVTDEKAEIEVRYTEDNNVCSWLKLDIGLTFPQLNSAEMKINDYTSETQSISIDNSVNEIVDILNRNLAQYRSPVRGDQKMNFNYNASTRTVSFNVNFNTIVPLTVRPDIFSIESGDDYVGIFAQIMR